MLRGPRLNYFFRLFLDLLLMGACAWWAAKVEGHTLSQGLLLFSFITWYVTARAVHFYTSITLFTYSQEMTIFLRVLFTHMLLLFFGVAIFTDQVAVLRSFLLYYHLFILIGIPFSKYVYRVVTAYVRNQYKYIRKILVVGSAELSASLYRSGMLINNLRYTLVGIVGERPPNGLAANYLGSINELETTLKNNEVDEVFLALPSSQAEQINFVIDCCEKKQVQVNVINDFSRIGSGTLRTTTYAGFPVVGLRYFPLDDAENRIFKRSFDILFSLLFLVLIFSWLAPIIALLIKLNSRGPIFFKQDRWGLNNEKIVCYKFRTMRHAIAKVESEFKQAGKNDVRVTTLGRFLRKTSLDELPQFLNVLKGDMSVVGPRPHPIPLSLESKDIVQNYMMRHLVKPGITGWAQVNGSRGEVQSPGEMRRRVAFDLWYIENWSFWLDCQIIFQTVVNLLKGDENAY
jgi:putative colanic acid biosysnthesis UDP-glucose lipid carrier transferase